MKARIEVCVGDATHVFTHALQLRASVFVKEQHVPVTVEVDGEDHSAVHFVAYDANGTPAAAARLRVVTQCSVLSYEKPVGKIERVCVAKEYRGKGVGAIIVRAVEDYALHTMKLGGVVMYAQSHSIEFYRRLGYTVKSEEFVEGNIPHRVMAKL